MKKWDCVKAFHEKHGDDGGLLHSMQSRIDSWKREYFPLDIINNLIDENKLKREWKKAIYKRIDVLASDNNYYNLVEDICDIEFRKSETNGRLSVYITLPNKNVLQVYTPCANGEKRAMSLANIGQLSVDHEIPLKMIVDHIRDENPDIALELDKIINAKKNNPQLKAEKIAENIQREVNKELLIKLKEKVLEDTVCVFMERGENSKKSNVTTYKKYRKDGNTFLLIMEEGVINPVDLQKYTIYRVLNNHEESDIKMMKE